MDLTLTINYCDIWLKIKGFYTSAEEQTYDYPGSPPDFEIEEIYLVGNDINIIDLFNFSMYDELAEMCIDQIENK